MLLPNKKTVNRVWLCHAADDDGVMTVSSNSPLNCGTAKIERMRILCYLVLLLLSQHLMSVPLPLLLFVASRMVIKRQAGAGVMQQQQQVLSSATISQPWKEWSSKQQWNWLAMPISFKQCFAIMNHSVLWVKFLLALIISIIISANHLMSFNYIWTSL